MCSCCVPQLRIHDSVHCDYYLLVKSQPIIEHCTAARFAPYTMSYPALSEQLQVRGFSLIVALCSGSL